MVHMTDQKAQLREYFDGLGFERWTAIYGDAEVSRVRRTIREGHNAMLAHVESWIGADSLSPDAHVLDAGCGTGVLTTALARRGMRVTAVDLAPQMAAATRRAAAEAGVGERVRCVAGDLEEIDELFDAVACLDVLIHYPRESFGRMVQTLAARTRGPLIFTYAPHEPLLAALHWVGGHFPSANRRTEIQLIRAAQVEAELAAAGMAVRRSADIRSGFYHVTLVEARRG